MLTLTSFWGTRAYYPKTPCDFFFQPDRPTQYQETHSTVKKKGMAYHENKGVSSKMPVVKK